MCWPNKALSTGPAIARGYLAGFGILPAESVRDLSATAKRKPLAVPAAAAPDPGYRPSTVIKEFVRWRDLTCRWPGCDRPVDKGDIDHTVPWPDGPTHPSNTKAYCRVHHFVKTFYGGPGGWTDQEMPDGARFWTCPFSGVSARGRHRPSQGRRRPSELASAALKIGAVA